MNGSRGVVYALLVAFGVFVLSGAEGSRRLSNGIAKVTGGTTKAATAGESGITAQTLVGWAMLFIILIALADIEATGDLASAFAYLLLLTILLAFGPDAFDNLTRLLGQQDTGGGGGKKPLPL